MYIYHLFQIQTSVDEHVGCFHVLTIVNSAAMSMRVHVSSRLSELKAGILQLLHSVAVGCCTVGAWGEHWSNEMKSLELEGLLEP